MDIQIVNHSNLDRVIFRLDAEYYQLQELLQKIYDDYETVKLKDICSMLTQGPNPKFVNEPDINCLTGRNIATGIINYEGSDYVNEQTFNEYSKFHLQTQDILITLKGAGSTGKIAVYDNKTKAMFSRNLGIIRLRDDSPIDYRVLYAILSSKTGQKLIDRGVTGGTGQLTLPTSYLKNMDIPMLNKEFQEIIKEIFSTVTQLHEVFDLCYQKAQNILLEELSLIDWRPKGSNVVIGSFAGTLKSNRIDAEHFQPKYNSLIEHIKQYNGGYCTLHDLTSMVDHGKQPPYDKDGELPFFSQVYIKDKEIDYSFLEMDIAEESVKRVASEFVEKYPQYVLSNGTITYYSVGSNLGYCQPYLSDKFAVPGSFVTIIRADEEKIDPIALAVIMNSTIGRTQSSKWKRASAQPYIYPNDLKQFVIPKISRELQMDIRKEILEGYEAKATAKKLMDSIRKSVDMAIKTNDEIALEWLSNEYEGLHSRS